MATLKKYLAYMLGGAILGAVISSLLAPGLISWYHDPGAGVPPGYDLSPFARRITSDLLRAQLIGAAVGAVLLLILGLLLARGRSTPAATMSPPTHPGAPPAP